MTEKYLSLEQVDPVDVFGVNNRIFNQFVSHFPKVKAVARGSEIYVAGAAGDISEFEEKFKALSGMAARKSHLSEYDVESIFGENVETGQVEISQTKESIIVFSTEGRAIKARTVNQKKMVSEYYQNDLLFALGPAGSGKTYTAIALAVRALKNREVKRLILTRPAVEAGERLGFLPGDLKDKLDPYLQPLYDALGDMIPAKNCSHLWKRGLFRSLRSPI